jgi:hypothetical protein
MGTGSASFFGVKNTLVKIELRLKNWAATLSP